jgi:hypothetical protein
MTLRLGFLSVTTDINWREALKIREINGKLKNLLHIYAHNTPHYYMPCFTDWFLNTHISKVAPTRIYPEKSC